MTQSWHAEWYEGQPVWYGDTPGVVKLIGDRGNLLVELEIEDADGEPVVVRKFASYFRPREES